MKGDRERCLKAGMDQYVSKPVRVHELLDAMATALGLAAISETLIAGGGETHSDRSPAHHLVDWHEALQAVDGDRATLSSVVEAFLSETPKLIEQLQQALALRDAAGLRRASHTLKSSLRFFGAHAAADEAWQLELYGKEENLEAAGARLDGLMAAVDHIVLAVQHGPPSP
jgi:HPt (histidine-containing phosphotransfer) domain-containing protein